jgi:hypothetical protein
MMRRMVLLLRNRLTHGLMALLSFLASPGVLWAQDELPAHDARLENYAESVLLQSGGTAMAWLLLVALAVLCLAVLFKDARRTHLD